MSRLKTRQTSCYQDDLSSHRSIALFTLTIDLQYNASSEIINLKFSFESGLESALMDTFSNFVQQYHSDRLY